MFLLQNKTKIGVFQGIDYDNKTSSHRTLSSTLVLHTLVGIIGSLCIHNGKQFYCVLFLLICLTWADLTGAPSLYGHKFITGGHCTLPRSGGVGSAEDCGGSTAGTWIPASVVRLGTRILAIMRVNYDFNIFFIEVISRIFPVRRWAGLERINV